jgi:hypothetical protein
MELKFFKTRPEALEAAVEAMTTKDYIEKAKHWCCGKPTAAILLWRAETGEHLTKFVVCKHCAK